MAQKSKSKTKAKKTAATVASMTAQHEKKAKASGQAARAQGVGAYRRLVTEPEETKRAEGKRKSSGFADRAAALCRYPVVKNLRQASETVRGATQAVVETARGVVLELWRRYSPS